MAKKRKKATQKKTVKKQNTYGYCSDCGSRKKINGVCHVCGTVKDAKTE